MNPTFEFAKYIGIDEEGRLHSHGQRWTDEEIGLAALQSLKKTESGAYTVNLGGEPAFVEAFDRPLVALSTEKSQNFIWQLTAPYGFSATFDIRQIMVDPWDRFCGVTTDGISFVLSRAAQARFFNLLEVFDDESITVDGQQIVLPPWPPIDSEVKLDSNFWSEKYQATEQPGWDLGGPHPALATAIPQLKLPKSRILVVGAGRGHDAAFFARAGHKVTAVDYSASAIEGAKKLYSDVPNLQFVQADVLKPVREWPKNVEPGGFDIVFDHTCYCAIPPQEREALIQYWVHALHDQGQLLGIFPLFDRPSGPPFSCSEWELRERLKRRFQFLYWTRTRVTAPNRLGQEILIFASRRSK